MFFVHKKPNPRKIEYHGRQCTYRLWNALAELSQIIFDIIKSYMTVEYASMGIMNLEYRTLQTVFK